MSFELHVDLNALNAHIGAMEEDVIAAARPAAQAGSEILYQAVKRNVAALGKKTGNLDRAIYQAYSTHHSTPEYAAYEISWNPRKAPHAYLVENGHIQKYATYLGKDGNWYTNKNAPLAQPKQVAAKAFVKSAQAMFPAAQAAMEEKFFEVLNGI